MTLVEARGLAIEIARLRVELRRQLAEVHASRARIVSAGNAERRRIERDLHDGAQQRLVSIGSSCATPNTSSASHRHSRRAVRRSIAPCSRSPSAITSCASWHTVSHRLSSMPDWIRRSRAGRPRPAAGRSRDNRRTLHHRARGSGLLHRVREPDQRDQARGATAVVVSAQQQDGRLVVSVADDGIGGAVLMPARG